VPHIEEVIVQALYLEKCSGPIYRSLNPAQPERGPCTQDRRQEECALALAENVPVLGKITRIPVRRVAIGGTIRGRMLPWMGEASGVGGGLNGVLGFGKRQGYQGSRWLLGIICAR